MIALWSAAACRRFLVQSLLRNLPKQASSNKAQASLRTPY
jgi:hypothetical protein